MRCYYAISSICSVRAASGLSCLFRKLPGCGPMAMPLRMPTRNPCLTASTVSMALSLSIQCNHLQALKMKQLNHKPECAPQHHSRSNTCKNQMGCILRPCLFLVSTCHLMSQPSLRRKPIKEQYICGIIYSLCDK